LREQPRNFPVSNAAARDVAGGWRELNLRFPHEETFTRQEVVLQTNQRVFGSIAVLKTMDSDFYGHRANWFRRIFHLPKYFQLEYAVMIGRRQYSVSTIY
jgi:hypothetical protein